MSVEVISACVAAAGAVVTFWMATFTRRTTVEKIRLDLYDRRFAIYEKTLAFKLMLDNSTTAESIQTSEFIEARRAFIKSMRESQFLFRPDSGIFERMTRLHRASFDVTNVREFGGKNLDPQLTIKLFNNSIAAVQFFDGSIVFLEHAMAPYLNFQEALLVEDEKVRVLKTRFWEWFLSDFKVAPDPLLIADKEKTQSTP
jgi:hypothetical protein